MAAGGGPCGRGDAPSSPNLKAAGSDIAPSSPAFLATRELITADSDAWKEFFSSLALSSPHRMAAGSHPYGAEASSTRNKMARYQPDVLRYLEKCGDEATKPLLLELLRYVSIKSTWVECDERGTEDPCVTFGLFRCQESDEEIEDEEDPYFDVLVDKFILAAYPQGPSS
jgi:hypothetical protein